MKIRTTFVTNSSSSSFVLLRIDSKALYDILAPELEFLKDRYDSVDAFEEDGIHEVEIQAPDCSSYVMYESFPTSLKGQEGLINTLIGFFSSDIYDELFNDDGDLRSDEETLAIKPDNESEKLALDILRHRAEIEADVEQATIIYGDYGWGEDETRFCQIDENRRNKIAAKRGIKPEELSDDDYFEAVRDMSSDSSKTYYYEKGKGPEPEVTESYIVS